MTYEIFIKVEMYFTHSYDLLNPSRNVTKCANHTDKHVSGPLKNIASSSRFLLHNRNFIGA